MKNIIKKWLGIVEPTPPPSNEELRRLVGQAVMDALEGKLDSTASCWFFSLGRARNLLQEAIERTSRETASIAAEVAIAGRIDNEKFIDTIIERISKKQLPH